MTPEIEKATSALEGAINTAALGGWWHEGRETVHAKAVHRARADLCAAITSALKSAREEALKEALSAIRPMCEGNYVVEDACNAISDLLSSPAPTPGAKCEACPSWQCFGCRWGFSGEWQKVCPACGRTGYWTGSVEPGAKLWRSEDRAAPTPPHRCAVCGTPACTGKDKPPRCVDHVGHGEPPPGRPCPMTGCPNRILDTGLHCGDHPSRVEPPCERCGVSGIEPFSWPERPCSACGGTGQSPAKGAP